MKKNDAFRTISEASTSVWKNINSNLPILSELSVWVKVKALCTKALDINRGRMKKSVRETCCEMLDRLFDISSCECSLDTANCGHPLVKCAKILCAEEHVVCTCPLDKKVPTAERLYLRDLRLKTKSERIYQMAGTQSILMNQRTQLLPQKEKPPDTNDSSEIPSELSETEMVSCLFSLPFYLHA